MKHAEVSRRKSITAAAMMVAALVIGAVSPVSAQSRQKSNTVQATATIGMVADLVKQVGKDRVEVDQLMGPGVDLHLYKPTPQDAARLVKAEVIFYSGLMLEGRMGDLFAKLARSGKKAYPITESVDEVKLLEPAEFEGHYDPHLWFDVSLWAQTVPTIVKGLSEADPAGKSEYEKNGKALSAKLDELHAWCRQKAAEVPESARILVTSHDAYNYFGRAYGFKVVGWQGVSTVTEATLADLIRKENVKAIFVETSVNPAAIKRVSEDARVKIGGELFSDAMGEPGEIKDGFDVGSYEGMVKYNLSTIVEALK